MAPDLYPYLQEIRTENGLYGVLSPEKIEAELGRKGYPEASLVSQIVGESRDMYMHSRTKPRLNELKSLAQLISGYLRTDSKKVLFVLNDLNDCVFPDTVSRC